MRWRLLIPILLPTLSHAQSNRLDLLSKLFPQTYQKLFRNIHSATDIPRSYEFDANRTPKTALAEGRGGHCNTHAQVAAYALMQNGVPAKDLRIVSAVNDRSFDSLCQNRKGSPARPASDGLSGHVFLLLRSDEHWDLINTTTVPGSPDSKRFGKLGLEYVPFFSPDELDARMQRGPTPIPSAVKQTLPPQTFGSMTIFHVARPDQYLLHDFAGRRKLIASGTLNSDVCRYGSSARAAGAEATLPRSQPSH